MSLVRDGALARIRVPGGILTSGQLRTIADIAETHGSGLIDLTNRANLQVRGLDQENATGIAHRLTVAGLLAPDPGVDRIRNITASPLAGLDESELLDVRTCVAALDTMLQRNRAARTLSPKFAFVVDGGGRCKLDAVGHDIAFYAARIDERTMFPVSLAGKITGIAIAPDDMAKFAESAIDGLAAASLDRMQKFLGHQSPAERAQSIATEAGIVTIPVPAAGQVLSPGPVVLPVKHRIPDEAGHHAGSSTTTSWFTLGIPLARLSAGQMSELARLAVQGNDTVRLTPWQSIVLPHISIEAAASIRQQADRLGLITTEPAVHVIACAGASGCTRTEVDTRTDARHLIAALRKISGIANGGARPVVHLSGCVRGCACPAQTDILALASAGNANYTLYGGSRPAIADQETPVQSNVGPEQIASTIGRMLEAKTRNAASSTLPSSVVSDAAYRHNPVRHP